MESFKKHWFKIGILVIFGITVLSYFLVPALNTEENLTPQNKKIVSPVQYRKLDDECKKYGYENWGPAVDLLSKEYREYREYQYSIPLNTCVMESEHYFQKSDKTLIILKDIYLDKHILLFNSECEDTYRYIYEEILSEEEFTERLIEKCPTRDDILNKKIEIFER
ncbi:MAG: hypothetical protein KAS07_02795 [Candidatus Pacebacteria bacterium]|nr:hypothetical protein [Candidatus Paceibacterota bacterium]